VEDNNEILIHSKGAYCFSINEMHDSISDENKGRKFLINRYSNNSKENPIKPENCSCGGLFRLFIKNGEYVYVRATDIIMIESCDHLVKVYLGINGKVKLTLRHNTLKDFLSLLPQSQFIRISRFCAVNILRLSGGNCNDQTFEFDFKISIKIAHSVSHKVFSTIGK
jgi:hypothetical protein